MNETRTIPESELILNPDGSVYHLNLRPEQVADTIILVGDPDRVRRVSLHFDKIEVVIKKREFITHTGYLGDKRISVISTGIGTDNIDIVINELDALVNIDFQTRKLKEKHTTLNFIRVGTSGSLQENVPLDSLVISAYGLGLDGLMHFYEMPQSDEEVNMFNQLTHYIDFEQIKMMPYVVKASESLLANFDHNFIRGITATCLGFYGPQGRIVRAIPSFPHLLEMLQGFHYKQYAVTNFEMETAGIYGLGSLLGHEFLSLNAIIANRVEQTFSKNPAKTIDRLIEITLENIINIRHN